MRLNTERTSGQKERRRLLHLRRRFDSWLPNVSTWLWTSDLFVSSFQVGEGTQELLLKQKGRSMWHLKERPIRSDAEIFMIFRWRVCTFFPLTPSKHLRSPATQTPGNLLFGSDQRINCFSFSRRMRGEGASAEMKTITTR